MKFDRERQKQYAIPVIVSDSEQADPRALTGTSLFTVIIGDENDNDMKPGASAIQVFNFEVRGGGDEGGDGVVTACLDRGTVHDEQLVVGYAWWWY